MADVVSQSGETYCPEHLVSLLFSWVHECHSKYFVVYATMKVDKLLQMSPSILHLTSFLIPLQIESLPKYLEVNPEIENKTLLD